MTTCSRAKVACVSVQRSSVIIVMADDGGLSDTSPNYATSHGRRQRILKMCSVPIHYRIGLRVQSNNHTDDAVLTAGA